MTRLSARPGGAAATAASALVRAFVAVAAGFALTAGLSLVLWALTPSGGANAAQAVASGAVAFAAAHFLPIAIEGVALTLTPLLLTAVMVGVIMTAVGHARPVHGRLLETLHACVFVVAYGVGVDLLVRLTAPASDAQPGFGAPLAVAALGAVLSLACGATGWRAWWVSAVPAWARRAVHAAAGTALAVVSIASVVLAAALVASVPDALRIAQLTVHSAGDALGMTMVSLAFVPNAVIAAIGYVSGAGFAVGAASYSPLAVHGADLPAIPLLAAVPDGAPGAAAWATLAAPALAALVGGWMLRRVGETRWQRFAACGLTAVVVGAVMAGLAAVGGGGVAGGPWSRMGSAAPLVGALIAGSVLVVTAATTLPVGWRALPWRTAPDVPVGAESEMLPADGIESATAGSKAAGSAASGATGATGSEEDVTPDDLALDATDADGESLAIPPAGTGRDTPPDDPLADIAHDAANAAASDAAPAAAPPDDEAPDIDPGLAEAG